MKRRTKTAKRRFPARLKALAALALAAFLAASANFVVQILRKPTEILRYLAGPGGYGEREFWRRYRGDFEASATRDMTPEFLAALAYIESSGDRLAAPPWRFSLNRDWTKIYAPASSAVGLFQFTEETFLRASRFCVHNGEVAREGPWYDLGSCWFTSFKTRLSPSDSADAAAAYLQHEVDEFLAGRGQVASRDKRQRLAAVIHLCGPGTAARLASASFRAEGVGKCGDQSAAAYVRRVEALRGRFARMRRGGY